MIRNFLGQELAMITTIHSKEILLSVANLFFITNEGVFWFLKERNRLDLRMFSLALKLVYVYASLELIISPCDAANILVRIMSLFSANIFKKGYKHFRLLIFHGNSPLQDVSPCRG